MTAPIFANWLSQTNDVTQIFLGASEDPNLINLAGGLPDPSVWPVAELASLATTAMMDHPDKSLSYSPIPGLSDLRDTVARRFSKDGLTLTRDNVMIVSGGMQALDLIGKVLLDQDDIIAAQSPAYLGAIDAWRPRGPKYRALDLEAQDFDPAPALGGAKFAYTVPNFSNPTGRLVLLAQRHALVQAAYETGTYLVEDDPYGTLYYEGDVLPSMLEISASMYKGPYTGPVIYLGTLSKQLAPGLRIGWVIAAPEVISALVTGKQGGDMCTAGLTQVIANTAITSGLVERILPKILELNKTRRDALCAAMDAYLSDLFQWRVPQGGMFVWATARNPQLNTDRLLRVAIEHGVCISPSSAFDPLGLNHSAIRINFTLNTAQDLAEGIQRLAAATRAVLDTQP
ncbi:2-aminoadipate aminotransferase [Amylibacter marinus]|uniref:2-aminoadipate aminotransferase n=1 Tax=Amylibacter marinus TaxID=1475483 RepID=A0ABQ5VV99_9RHOB|nr:PLP-dependent aminotransferase family protein [Amylibacter marinus]GLQ35182.1 2-aminoadipate aminotransferase [Amylibacter marinus]